MEFNNLPDFEIVELDEEIQENESGQEKTEEIVETNDTPEVKEDTPDYPENSDPLAIQTFNHLKEHGIIDEDEEFDGTWETLEESLSSLPQKVLNSIIEQAPDITKQLVKFAFSSENITKEDFQKFAKAYLEEFDNSTPEIETMDEARNYLEQVYKERGMRPSAVRAALDALEEDDALIDEAKTELEKTNQNSKKKTEEIIQEKQKADQERIDAQRVFVSQISSELDSIGWSKQRIEKVKTMMSNNNLGSTLNKVISSPKAIIKLADFLDYYNEKDGDIDYSNFMNKAETKKALSFKDKIEKSVNTPNSNTKSTLTNPNLELDDLEPILN